MSTMKLCRLVKASAVLHRKKVSVPAIPGVGVTRVSDDSVACYMKMM